jgi:hypothetical protein
LEYGSTSLGVKAEKSVLKAGGCMEHQAHVKDKVELIIGEMECM